MQPVPRAWKRVRPSHDWFYLVFFLIGWERGTSFLDQSESLKQTNLKLIFNELPLPGPRANSTQNAIVPGGTPPYKLYRYVPPQRVWFLSHFGLKTGIHFDHYGLKSGIIFEGTTGAYKRICLFNSKWIVEKEKYPKCIIQAEYY